MNRGAKAAARVNAPQFLLREEKQGSVSFRIDSSPLAEVASDAAFAHAIAPCAARKNLGRIAEIPARGAENGPQFRAVRAKKINAGETVT